MSVLMTTSDNGLLYDADEDTADRLAGASFPAATGELMRLQVAPAVPRQQILYVEFRSPDGRSWHTIGGGDTVAEAIIFARENCPGTEAGQ